MPLGWAPRCVGEMRGRPEVGVTSVYHLCLQNGGREGRKPTGLPPSKTGVLGPSRLLIYQQDAVYARWRNALTLGFLRAATRRELNLWELRKKKEKKKKRGR